MFFFFSNNFLLFAVILSFTISSNIILKLCDPIFFTNFFCNFTYFHCYSADSHSPAISKFIHLELVISKALVVNE